MASNWLLSNVELHAPSGGLLNFREANVKENGNEYSWAVGGFTYFVTCTPDNMQRRGADNTLVFLAPDKVEMVNFKTRLLAEL